jgi:ectoine hydroxylase-related dioxygenase (phytanoyl-CoA dioxygenase family)
MNLRCPSYGGTNMALGSLDIDFSVLGIQRSLYKNGLVLVRRAIPSDQVARYREALHAIYRRHREALNGHEAARRELLIYGEEQFDNLSRGDVSPEMFEKVSGLSMVDFFAAEKLQRLLKAVLGSYQPVLGTFMSVSGNRSQATSGIGPHCDGIIQGTEKMVIAFWSPLDPCGKDAPGLAMVRAPLPHTFNYMRRKFPGKSIPGWSSMTEWNDTGAFRLAALEDEFGKNSFFTPEMGPGDLLIFNNYTIHWSHVNDKMTNGRSAAIQRWQGEGAELRNQWIGWV